jgi:hypothetical protein
LIISDTLPNHSSNVLSGAGFSDVEQPSRIQALPTSEKPAPQLTWVQERIRDCSITHADAIQTHAELII